jgi:hypothetical protein
MSFVTLDYSTCEFGKISWTDPKTKEELVGDRVPKLFIDDYLILHQEIIKKYKIKVISS